MKNEILYLTELIKEIHHSSKGRYGSPRILASLKQLGERTSSKRVQRLMKENNLLSKVKRKYKTTTDSKHKLPIAANLLNQDFTAKVPNEVWVSDITYIWTGEGWFIVHFYRKAV